LLWARANILKLQQHGEESSSIPRPDCRLAARHLGCVKDYQLAGGPLSKAVDAMMLQRTNEKARPR
jgi:hypothetical protein